MKFALYIVGGLMTFIGFLAWMGSSGVQIMVGQNVFLVGLLLVGIGAVVGRLDTLIASSPKPPPES